MTADHRYGQEESDDFKDRKPGSSEEQSLDGPDENGSIFLDCIDATATEIIEWKLNNAGIVQKQASANNQFEEFGSDQTDDITNAEDDCCEDESMFLDCIETSEEDDPRPTSQLTKADIVHQTDEKKNEECFTNIVDDMTALADDCNEEERMGSDEINENYESGDCSPVFVCNKEDNPPEDSHSMETKQAQADKTNPHATRTYRDDTKDELKSRGSMRKSIKKGVNNYASFSKQQNKFRDTDYLGRKPHGYSKNKTSVRKQKRMSIGSGTCQKKIEITVKLEIKVVKYATRNNISQSGTCSKNPHCNKIYMEDNSMCAGFEQNLNGSMRDWNRKIWYAPDNYVSTKGDEICYLDFLRNRIPLVNHNFIALPTQPLPPRDSHTLYSQIRSSTSRNDHNGFIYHRRCPFCQYQMIVISEPSQRYTHRQSDGQYHEFYSSLRTSSNISLLLHREKPVEYVRDSFGLQRPMPESGLGGNSPFSKCTVQLSSYEQLSAPSTFAIGYFTNNLSTGERISASATEHSLNEHIIRSQRQELGVTTDLPSNISERSSTEIDIRSNDIISEAGQSTSVKDAIEAVITTIEQPAPSEQCNNKQMRMQNFSCQSAESNTESSPRALESIYFQEKSPSEFTGRLQASNPTVETSLCETKLHENNPVVRSERSPGERHLKRNVNMETDAQTFKFSAISEDCTSFQQDFSCGKYEMKEQTLSSRRRVPIIVRKDLLLLQEEINRQTMDASNSNTDCAQECHSCKSLISRDSHVSSLTHSDSSQLNIFGGTNDKKNKDFNPLVHKNFNPTESVTFGTYTINIFVIRMECIGIALGPNHDAYSMSCPNCRSKVHINRTGGTTFDESISHNGYEVQCHVIPVIVTSNHQDITTINVADESDHDNSVQQFSNDGSSAEVANVSELNSSPKIVMRESSARLSLAMFADTTFCESKQSCQPVPMMDDQSSATEHLRRDSVLENTYPSYEINHLGSDPTRVEATQNQLQIKPIVQRNQRLHVPEHTADTPPSPRNELPCEPGHLKGDVRGDSISASQQKHNLALPEGMYSDLYLANCDPLRKQIASKPPENVNQHLSTQIQVEPIPEVQFICPSNELGELGNIPEAQQVDHSHAADDLKCYFAERGNEISSSLEQLEYSPVFEGSNISLVSEVISYGRPVPSNQLLPVNEHLNTGSDISNGCQSRGEPLSNINIDLPEQLGNEKADRRTDLLTATKSFHQDRSTEKDDSLFASRQKATKHSSRENYLARAKSPSMDIGYNLKMTSEACRRMQRGQTRGSPLATDMVDILVMEDEKKEDQCKSEKHQPNNGADAGPNQLL